MVRQNTDEWKTVFKAQVHGNQRWYFEVANEALGALLDKFELSQGYLYHYTDQNAANNIFKGETWLTRADTFLDQNEIDFGSAVLSNAGSATLAKQRVAEYLSILDSLTRDLRQCFVWSLSQEADNDFLKANYSGDHGAILKLPSNYSHAVRSSWHLTPTGDGYSADCACDLYDQLEGFVVYDPVEQDEIAKLACNAYAPLNAELNTYDKPQRIITAHHLRTALTQCLILFKKPCFSEEKEYRLALVTKHTRNDEIEHQRGNREKEISYIKLRLPKPAFQEMTQILAID